MTHNLFLDGGGVAFNDPNTQFLYNIVLAPVYCYYLPPVAVCNDFVGAGAECVFQQWGDQNFSADPLFCGVPGSGNYTLRSDSPCAPGNGPLYFDCGLVGPLPVACGTVQVEPTTWGAIKARYR